MPIRTSDKTVAARYSVSGSCAVQPLSHGRIGERLQRFRDYICVENDHEKSAGSIGLRSRLMLSSMPP